MKRNLAALILVGGLTGGGFWAPVSAAEGDPPCGTPAVEAVVHIEKQWSLTTDVVEYLWTRVAVLTEAIPAWTENVVVEDAWTERIEHPAVTETVSVAAVYGDLWEFRHAATGAVRYEADPSWNADVNPSSTGWVATGNRNALVPAHDEIVIVEGAWTEVIEHLAVTETVEHPAVPAVTQDQTAWSTAAPGPDWTQTSQVRQVDGAVDLVWAAEAPAEGWLETGETRVVEDSPAVPAGPPCPAYPLDEELVEQELVDEDPVEKDPVGKDPVSEDPVDEEPVFVTSVGAGVVDEEPVSATPVGAELVPANPVGEGPVPSASPALTEQVLPNAGGAHPLLVWLGVALAAAGGYLTRRPMGLH